MVLKLHDPVVIYHHPCMDGFTAAWVAQRALGRDTVMYPMAYGDTPDLSRLVNRAVYMLDISFDRATMLEIARVAASFTVLDHHESARDALAGIAEEMCALGCDEKVVFEMKQSGAGLTWDHFNPNHPQPPLLSYIEDRDLWRFALVDSRGVNAYLATQPKDFDTWTGLMAMTSRENIGVIQDMGAAIWAYIQAYAAEAFEIRRSIVLFGQAAAIVALPKKAASETLHYFLEHDPEIAIAISYQQLPSGLFEYSLRSRNNGPNVADLAKRFTGGGGHAHSAGFTLDSVLF